METEAEDTRQLKRLTDSGQQRQQRDLERLGEEIHGALGSPGLKERQAVMAAAVDRIEAKLGTVESTIEVKFDRQARQMQSMQAEMGTPRWAWHAAVVAVFVGLGLLGAVIADKLGWI